MPRYLFSSHDGFGLGHLRRNMTIAKALLADHPAAEVVIATGVADDSATRANPDGPHDAQITTLALPPLVKGRDGSYHNPGMAFEAALAHRSRAFDLAVERFDPDVVIVDRHPYGIAGELQAGLTRAHRRGARVVLGLRDVLDEPSAVSAELSGPGWAGVEERFDHVLVYGDPALCDHRREYGLDLPLRYVGWVVDQRGAGPGSATPPVMSPDTNLMLVAAGGGGDGEEVYRLGLAALACMPDWRGLVLAGPYASNPELPTGASASLRRRVEIRRQVAACGPLYARAGAVVQMAGYNSTFEALAAGLRPVLVPRRAPRREQAIRACRLAALGLVDTVDEAAHPEELAWLLRRRGRVTADQLAAANIGLNGARVAAGLLASLAGARAA